MSIKNPIAKINWTERKVRLKARFIQLTDADFKFDDSRKEEMMEKIRIKLGKNKEELARIIAAL